MRIVIDARLYGLENAGIGRYIINLIREITKFDCKNDYFILLRKKYYQSLCFSNQKVRKVLADYPHYSFREQFFLPLQLIKLRPNLVHFPHFNVPIFWWGKYVVTIHDLIKHQFRGPEATTKSRLFYWFKYLNYKFLVRFAIGRAVRIITPSKWTKKGLKKQYGLNSAKIAVIYEGVNEKFKTKNSELKAGDLLEKYKIKKPFLIYTGSLYSHKNVERLVMAVKDLNEIHHLNLFLVVVCGRNVFWERFRKQVKKLKADGFVILTGFVSDDELNVLYRQAEVFVFPSLLEGFGLPGLEAMAVGLPVLASDSSCLPEVYGSAAVYFNPLNVKQMADKIKAVVTNRKLRVQMRALGYQQVRKYSWARMAKQTLEIYESSFGL